MGLTLALSYEEQNDNKLLTLTDTTADWDVGENIAVTEITSLTLDITITTSDGTEVVYDQLDLYTLGDGPFVTQSELTWDIDVSMLEVDGVALGTSDDELPDGIWKFTYVANVTNTLQESVLLDGRVRAAVYELLRVLPTIYNCQDCKSKQVLDAIYSYALLNVMQSDAYIAKTEELLDVLYTLERIITNGSNYTW